MTFGAGLFPPREGERASPPPGALGPASPVLPGAEESPGAAHGLFSRGRGAAPLCGGVKHRRPAGNLNTGPMPRAQEPVCPPGLLPCPSLAWRQVILCPPGPKRRAVWLCPTAVAKGERFFLFRFSTKFSSYVENSVSFLPFVYLYSAISLFNNTKS